MLYRTYRMYNNCMEIMVPSSLSAGTTSPIAQYHWQSEDKKVVVDVAPVSYTHLTLPTIGG